MDDNEKEIRQKLKDDFEHYASKCLKIRTEKGSIEPFLFNKSQKYIHALAEDQRKKTGKVRIISVKGRQLGFSTYTGGRFYWRITHSKGVKVFILTHGLDATNNLFDMSKRFHENCPVIVRPDATTNNSKELIFGNLDCGYKIGTAENKAVGRSSTIQFFHGSEVAFWANGSEHAKGIMQAIPNVANTEIFLESTANGTGNYFHEQYQLAEAGLSEFIPVFLPWYWKSIYQKELPEGFQLDEEEKELAANYNLSNEQLCWRRYKISELSSEGSDGVKSFKQEYPLNAAEAFQVTGENCFIPPELVMTARKCVAERYGPLIIGVDPARGGNDRTSIIRRQGRVAYGLISYKKKEPMEVVGIIHRIITEESPAKVFIDYGDPGAGIIDRLKEMGHDKVVVGVNFGGKATIYPDRFVNKRAEMWGLVRDWLRDQPCQIPDVDSLHSDLCAPKYTHDSLSRVLLQSKEAMKSKGIRSPDEGDALCLTFAQPVSTSMDKKYNDIARDIMQNQLNIFKSSKKNSSYNI